MEVDAGGAGSHILRVKQFGRAQHSPARRSPHAAHKAATKTTTDNLPAHSLTTLLAHLATLAPVDRQHGEDHWPGRAHPGRAHTHPTPSLELLGAPSR